MTTTTDELRRKLTELHVGYETIDGPDICFTEWSTHNGAFVFTARESSRSYGDNMLRVETCGVPKSCMIATPEQAIAATLGAGTCGEWRNECTYYDPTGVDAELWCEHCDEPLEVDWDFCPYCGRKVMVDA